MAIRTILVHSLFFAFFFAPAFQASAQTNQQTAKSAETALVKEDFKTKRLESPKPYIRKTSRIEADYESFAVVLKESDRPLLSTDPIFRRFGKIVYDKNENGLYLYMIRTPFKSEKAVRSFLDVVLLPRYEDAYVVKYKKGLMEKI